MEAARVVSAPVAPWETMETLLTAEAEVMARHAEAWIKGRLVEDTAETIPAKIAGYVRHAHAHAAPMRRSENIAVNYLATQRAGTPLADLAPVVPDFAGTGAADRAVARVLAAWKKHGGDDRFVAKVRDVMHGAVMARGRATVRFNAARAGVRVARVPEAGACFFCLMLASRGPEYVSAETALLGRDGEKYHAHCRCTIAEGRVGDDGAEYYPAKVSACVDFVKRNRRGLNTVEDWRAAVESGKFTKQTGLESSTRLAAQNVTK